MPKSAAYMRNIKRLGPKAPAEIKATTFLQLAGLEKKRISNMAMRNVSGIRERLKEKLETEKNKEKAWKRLQEEQFTKMNNIISEIGRMRMNKEIPRQEILTYFGKWINDAKQKRIIRIDQANELSNMVDRNIYIKPRPEK